MTLRLPFRLVKRGGRKEMQLPEGAALPPRTDNEDVARWLRALGSGYHGRINSVLRTYMLALISRGS